MIGLAGCVQTWSAPAPVTAAAPTNKLAAPMTAVGTAKTQVLARTVVELPMPAMPEPLPPEVERLLARPRGVEELDGWTRLIESGTVRSQAEAEVGSRIDGGEVRAVRAGRKLTVDVAGESPDAAVARCLALLRAAERAAHPDDTPLLRFLREERRRARRALEERRRALAEPDPAAAFSTVEQARTRLEAALAALDDSRTPGQRLLFPLLWAAQTERDGAAQALLDLSAKEGPLHPHVLEARAALGVAHRRLDAQRVADREWTRAFLADLESAPPPRKEERLPRARAAAQSAALTGADCVAPSAAPIDLADLAADCAHAGEERERLATRYGARHPEMEAAESRVAAARRAFAAARDARLAELGRERQEYEAGSGPSARLRERERLRTELEREAAARRVMELERISAVVSDRIDREAERGRSGRGVRVIMKCTAVP